jgi:hypothetical protein
LDPLVHSSLWVTCLVFVELFSLGLVEDRFIELGVSFYHYRKPIDL